MNFQDIQKQVEVELQTRSKHALDRIQINKHILFDFLDSKNLGDCEIVVNFDGSGDSGSVDHMEFQSDGSQEISNISFWESVEEVTLQNVCVSEGTMYSADGMNFMIKKSASVGELVESIVYDCLEAYYMGWENNDGAYGEITFYSCDRTINFECNLRSIEYNQHTL